MRCAEYQRAISSRVDGESIAIDTLALDAHLAECTACRAYERDAHGLRQRSIHAVDTTTNEHLVPRVLLALEPDRSSSRESQVLRIALGVVGIVQLGAALPQLLADDRGGLSAHATRHLGSYSAALAAGFIYAALRPRRIGGFMPVVAVLSICLVVTGIADVASGRTPIVAESSHLLEVAGLVILGFLWHLERPRRARRRRALRAVDDAFSRR